MDWIEKNRWPLLCLFLCGYFAFLLVRINGWGDFTGRDGIESIQCSEAYDNNRVIMLDGDRGTTWGLSETHQTDEQMVFKFRTVRQIGRIILMNCSEVESVPVTVWVSPDGAEWRQCEGKWSQETSVDTFIMDQPDMTRFLMLKYAGQTEGYWPITEVRFER